MKILQAEIRLKKKTPPTVLMLNLNIDLICETLDISKCPSS